jgi:putative nucleotidyltransferase with HDIG domain
MNRLETLRKLVHECYIAPGPNAAAWIGWAYPNHVLKVTEITEQLAQKYGANIEQAVAGALLHDIADTVMSRFNPDHEKQSLHIAKDLLGKAGFNWLESRFILDEIIGPHSCKEILPAAQEGKVMATADSMAHFLTDFYPHFLWQHYGPGEYEPFKAWVLKKIYKDFTRKIFFDEEREAIRPRYEAIETFFKL